MAFLDTMQGDQQSVPGSHCGNKAVHGAQETFTHSVAPLLQAETEWVSPGLVGCDPGGVRSSSEHHGQAAGLGGHGHRVWSQAAQGLLPRGRRTVDKAATSPCFGFPTVERG